MNWEPLLGPLTLFSVAAINAATYFLSRRAGKQDTKDVKEDAQDTKDPKEPAAEFSKTYFDDLILQLRSRIEECATRADAAVEEAKAAKADATAGKEEIRLLNMRTTDLEKQIVDLQGQIAAKQQEITRIEGERDSAIAERNTLQQLPEQGGRKAIGDFVELLIVAVDKRWPIPAAAGASDESEAGSQAA